MKSMDLTISWDIKIIPRKLWRWSRGVKKNMFELRSSWNMLKSGTKSMPTKREGMLKNSKASSGEIGVVACEQKKLARP